MRNFNIQRIFLSDIIFLLLNLVSITLNGIYTDKAQLTLQKEDGSFANYIVDLNSYVDKQHNWTEFFLPLVPVAWKFARGVNYPIMDKYTERLIGFPFISPYVSGIVQSKQRLALIWFSENNVIRFLPDTIKTALAQYLKTPYEKLSATLQNKAITFSSMMLSHNLTGGVQNPPDNLYNVRMHLWIAGWHPEKTTGNFKESVGLGIFEPYGLFAVKDSNYIPLNAFNSQEVNYHDGTSFSPNNAKFKIDTSKGFSSFWLLGVSEDKNKISVTYILIANSVQATNFIAKIFNESQNIWEFKNTLIQELPKTSFKESDKRAVITWITSIYKIAEENLSSLAHLERQLQMLFNSLQALNNRLNNF